MHTLAIQSLIPPLLFRLFAGQVPFEEKLVAPVRKQDTVFGGSVAISADGKRVVVGAEKELRRKGAAYLFEKSGSRWTAKRFVPKDILGATWFAEFGHSVAISADGKTFLVGSPYDSRKGKWSGAVYVFTQVGNRWQRKKIKPRGIRRGDYFGESLSLSADGKTFVAGAMMTDHRGKDSGVAYVFTRVGNRWKQTRLRHPRPQEHDAFGHEVAISGDGRTVVVGLKKNRRVLFGGTAFVYKLRRGRWSLVKTLAASDATKHAVFSSSLSISRDGSTIAVGAPQQDHRGAIYVFTAAGGQYRQTKLVSGDPKIRIGGRLRLSADGKTIVVGAPEVKVGRLVRAGGLFLFKRVGPGWQRSKLTLRKPFGYARFGASVAINPAGSIFAGGAPSQDWKGAVFLFRK